MGVRWAAAEGDRAGDGGEPVACHGDDLVQWVNPLSDRGVL